MTWQVPIGRDRAFLSDLPTALDAIVGGWQYSAASRFYSGRPLFFNQSLVATGDPTTRHADHDRWVNTAAFTGFMIVQRGAPLYLRRLVTRRFHAT